MMTDWNLLPWQAEPNDPDSDPQNPQHDKGDGTRKDEDVKTPKK